VPAAFGLALALAAILPGGLPGGGSHAWAQSGSRGPALGGPRGPAPAARRSAALNAPQFAPAGPQIPVIDVRVVGNRRVKTGKVLSYLRTRVERGWDPEVAQGDVRVLTSTGMFRNVRVFTERKPEGMIVTFEVFERPTIEYVRFVGNRGFSDRQLLRKCGLKEGDALNQFAVREARRKTEVHYHSAGFAHATVTIIEGDKPGDRGVVLMVNEGQLQMVWSVEFVGNTIVSDSRLKTQIASKPGWFYIIGGRVDHQKIEADVKKLTLYYRKLGYFDAKVGRELRFGDSGKWLSIKFVIYEGQRYRVGRVAFLGNQVFRSEDLATQVGLKEGQEFDLALLNNDVNAVRDVYGSHGYYYADIQAEPRFPEQPGVVDVVFNVKEGARYRVGRIKVRVAGDNPHTRWSEVLNRTPFRPGDVLNSRQIALAKRKIGGSQLFESNPQTGEGPQVVVKQPSLNQAPTAVAERPSRQAAPASYNERFQRNPPSSYDRNGSGRSW